MISLRFATSWQENLYGIVEKDGQLWSKFEIHHIFDVTLDKGPRFTPSTKRNCQFSTQSVSEKKIIKNVVVFQKAFFLALRSLERLAFKLFL